MRTVDDISAGTKPPDVTCTRVFAGCPESVSAARSWVAGFFPSPAAAADAALMTSELFTNAILYSASRLPGGQVTVSVGTSGGSVRVDVIDQGEVPPCIAAPPGLGKGLEIVSQLADVFGADGSDRWFTIGTAERAGEDLSAVAALLEEAGLAVGQDQPEAEAALAAGLAVIVPGGAR